MENPVYCPFAATLFPPYFILFSQNSSSHKIISIPIISIPAYPFLPLKIPAYPVLTVFIGKCLCAAANKYILRGMTALIPSVLDEAFKPLPPNNFLIFHPTFLETSNIQQFVQKSPIFLQLPNVMRKCSLCNSIFTLIDSHFVVKYKNFRSCKMVKVN